MERSIAGSIHRRIADEIGRKEIEGVKVLEGYRSGTVLITFEEYAYVVNIKKNKAIYLKCRIKNCNGSALITLCDAGNSQIQLGAEHVHSPDTEYISTVKYRCELRAKCQKQSTRACRQVFNKVSSRRQQKVTLEQQEILVTFMEHHRQLAYGLGHDQHSRQRSRVLWTQLARTLNQADGPSRPLDKWRKVWKSWRNKLRKQKELLEKQNLFRRKHCLTSLEERVLALKRLPREPLANTGSADEQDMDEGGEVHDTERSFQELVAAVKTIGDAEEDSECPISPASDMQDGSPADETYTSSYYDGVQGEEIILEFPSESFTVDETIVKTDDERGEASWNEVSGGDLISKLTGSMERMESTIKNMDESLKELISTVKVLVQLQQRQMQ